MSIPEQATLVACVTVVAVLLGSPVNAHAVDLHKSERRVEASLSLPHDLDGPSYLELVMANRPRKLYDRTSDPSRAQFDEYGLWRLHVPVKVDVFAVVFPLVSTSFLLFLDSFSLPNVTRGKIDPRVYHRALGL